MTENDVANHSVSADLETEVMDHLVVGTDLAADIAGSSHPNTERRVQVVRHNASVVGNIQAAILDISPIADHSDTVGKLQAEVVHTVD